MGRDNASADESDPWYPFAGDASVTSPSRNIFNRPLMPGASEEEWLREVRSALELMTCRRVAGLVVSLGLDMIEGDPFSTFQVRPAALHSVACALVATKLPLLIMLEGGYSQSLGVAAGAFVEGLLGL